MYSFHALGCSSSSIIVLPLLVDELVDVLSPRGKRNSLEVSTVVEYAYTAKRLDAIDSFDSVLDSYYLAQDFVFCANGEGGCV